MLTGRPCPTCGASLGPLAIGYKSQCEYCGNEYQIGPDGSLYLLNKPQAAAGESEAADVMMPTSEVDSRTTAPHHRKSSQVVAAGLGLVAIMCIVAFAAWAIGRSSSTGLPTQGTAAVEAEISKLVALALTATAQPTTGATPTPTLEPAVSTPMAVVSTATPSRLDEPATTPTSSNTPTPTANPTNTATSTPTSTASSIPAVIARSAVNLRAGPGTNYAVIGAAEQGQTYVVQGRTEDGTWFEVCCASERTAWVAASVVATSGDFAHVAVSQRIPPSPAPVLMAAAQIPTGWVEYDDPAGRFGIWHPAEWTARPGEGVGRNKEGTSLTVNAEENQPGGHGMFFFVENTPVDRQSVNTRTDEVLGTRVSTAVVLLPYDATRSISGVILRPLYDVDPMVQQVFIQVLKTLKAK